MKKAICILKEYPLAALLCTVADIAVTRYYTLYSIENDPTAMVYFIALYGAFTAILIFSAGWIYASWKAQKKENERRRKIRRNKICSLYSREFYNITGSNKAV